MAIEVKIPAVGESITSGLLSAWLKKDGELVKDGEPILMLETDKISTEIPAPGSGAIRIQVEAGQEKKNGKGVATIDQTARARSSPATQRKAPRNPPKTEHHTVNTQRIIPSPEHG